MKYLFWVLPFALAAYILHFIFGTVLGFCLLIFGRHVSDTWIFFVSRLFSRFCLFLLGVDIKVSGVLPLEIGSRPLCFISNHTSILDILVVYANIHSPMGFIAKKELAYIPLFNLSVLSHHVVFMDRSSLKKGVAAIERGVQKIKNGTDMLIFPEGTRSKTGSIAPFKYGSFRLASESGALVVPLTIKGVREAFEDRKKCFQHTVGSLDIGPVFDASNMSGRNELNSLAIKIESHINNVYQTLGDDKNGE